jgi:hypothetical protein
MGGWTARFAAYQPGDRLRRTQPFNPVPAASCAVPLHDIQRDPYAATARTLEHMSVDHGRLHILVAQELLDRPDLGAVFEKVRGERVPQAVTARVLVDAPLPLISPLVAAKSVRG